ncbi:hypothetical protein FQA47_011537 [Oryzias melastigma]|uniref:C-type lectin domain-containing protein n=1 Tax=Oryzias melastigma TaxID=30732 RepID=A0A834F8L4_ORYME|nr:hypothetical protein FQA47_011537 [Oryzias melastigma]
MERLFLYLIAASALCDVFSVAQHHYLVFNETKTWTEAQSFCREKYADLATVDNMEDMNILTSLAVPQYLVQLKIQENSSLNLTDPVVLEELLRELKQRLKDQGVDGEPKLSWKRQSSGKIFN